jgi:hypothetical protein
MDIGSSRTVLVNIRSDVATYFGITASTATQDVVVTRRRKSHSRNRFEGVSDTTATSATVSASEWKTVRKAADIGSGKLIRIPTKLTSGTNGNIRYTSFRVPGNATIGAISNFIHSKFAATNRPAFFIMQSGARYPVAAITGDVNPGEGDTAPNPA